MGDPIDLPFQVREKIDCISKTLECPICLELMEKPCRTNCFHTFCFACIETVLSSKSPKCPLCKEKISKRMHENTKLAEVVDTVKELKEAFIADTGLATDPPPLVLPVHSNEAAAIGTSLTYYSPAKPKR